MSRVYSYLRMSCVPSTEAMDLDHEESADWEKHVEWALIIRIR